MTGLRRTIPHDDPLMASALARLDAEFEVPIAHEPVVDQAADRAIEALSLHDRTDRCDIPFISIDPAGSRDLDQAFALERDGTGYVLHYAIADVSAFVAAGDVIDAEAHRRGVTLYAPHRRALLYPPSLALDGASLLGGDLRRPAVLWSTRLDSDGVIVDLDVSRVVVRNREALSYAAAQRSYADEALDRNHPLSLLAEVGTLRLEQERARGAISIELPTQEIVRHDNEARELVYRAALMVERWSAQLSLLTGEAAARRMGERGIGLVRTLPDPDPRDIAALSKLAEALGVIWTGTTYAELIRSLDPGDSRHAALMTKATRMLRGAGYSVVTSAAEPLPHHGALRIPYAHVTAPLRRLADRYATDAVLLSDAELPDLRLRLDALPAVMRSAASRAGSLDAAVVDLFEALVMQSHIGETFDATVLERTPRGARIAIRELAVVLTGVEIEGTPGEVRKIRVVDADPVTRTVHVDCA